MVYLKDFLEKAYRQQKNAKIDKQQQQQQQHDFEKSADNKKA